MRSSIGHWFKLGAVRALENPLAVRLLQLPANERCIILMLHRFAAPGLHNGLSVGHDVGALRRILMELRKHDIALVDVDDCLHGLDSGQPRVGRSKLSVAFTVDDGYTDVVDVAAPVFAEFDCPVTSFVVPDVVEDRAWFWWDQMDWILRHSTKRALQAELNGQPVQLVWTDEASRVQVKAQLEAALKRVSRDAVAGFLDQLASLADTPLPLRAPSEYRVLSWEAMRAAERTGMRFGAHSMTHPILSRCDAAQSRFEIHESVRRIQAELTNPSRVFCYPNGNDDDYGVREYDAIRDSGLHYALSTHPGVVSRRLTTSTPDWRMRVPRFTFDERFGQLVRYFAS